MPAGDPNPYMWQDDVHGEWHWREPFAGWPPQCYPTAGVGDYNVPPVSFPPPPWPHWMNTPPPWWTQPAPGSAANMEKRIDHLEECIRLFSAEVVKLQERIKVLERGEMK